MKITPATLSVVQLFSAGNEQFLVPAYQRRYAWGTKQVADLFDDINLLLPDETHFLGTVLFLAQEHIAGLNPVELVDGQQRVTTICLLLKAIKNRYEELEESDAAKEINSYLICKGIDKHARWKLNLGDLDNPDFVKLMEEDDATEITNVHLQEAYKYFREWLGELSVEELNLFLYKLQNNAKIIRLDVAQAKDAYKLFETINNRGLRLSATDIIKNFLLGHASKIGDKALESVRESWKSLIIALDEIDADGFFRHFMAGVLERKITKSTVVGEFKSHYLQAVQEANLLSEYKHAYQKLGDQTSQDQDEDSDNDVDTNNPDTHTNLKNVPTKKISIVLYASKLKDASLVYQKIIKRQFLSQKINRHLYNLERIRVFPSYTFLLSVFQRELEAKDISKILRMIEVFMLRRHICEFRTNQLDDIFAKLVAVKDKNIVSEVRSSLATELPSDDEFKRKFYSYDFRKSPDRAHYVLEQLEYDLINHKQEYTLNQAEELHLEHIIPQTIETKKAKQEYGDWVTYLGADMVSKHHEYVNRIGNLTLLAQELNIKASNNPFKAKQREYKKSNIRISQDLVHNFSEFRFDEIKKRSKEFSTRAKTIWCL